MGLTRMRSYPHPYKTCEVLGHVCDREGKKESKGKGNYTPPEVILDRVRMEFAVFDPRDAKVREALAGRMKLTDADVVPGVIFIAREDYEGMDLSGDAAKGQVTLLFSADSKRLYAAETGHDKVAEIDVASGEVLRRIAAGKQGDGLAIAP